MIELFDVYLTDFIEGIFLVVVSVVVVVVVIVVTVRWGRCR
jgi:hypothetical protein